MHPMPSRPDPHEKRLVRLMFVVAIVGTIVSIILPFVM